jgi:hypothetical protein
MSLDAMNSTGIAWKIVCDVIVWSVRRSKRPLPCPADEKHTYFNGEKAYVATTVGDECVLGASLTLGADTESLTEAYGHFKTVLPTLCP